MSQPTVLITGAAGFIASHTAELFHARGCRVVGLDNFCDFYPRRLKEANVARVRRRVPGFAVHEADITDAGSVERIIGEVKPAAIVHLAAMAGVRPSIERPAHYAHVNLTGTANLLQAAVRHGVGKFLFASSSSVYGNQPKVPFSEQDPVDEPISPYAATKKGGELLCHTFWHLYKLPVFCLRFFTVYGPNQRPDLAIRKFTRLIDQGQPLPLFGDGSTSRDYTYIDDITDGIWRAYERCDRYRVYNLGGSDPVTLAKLVSTIEGALGKKAVIDRKPAQPGDVERTFADLTRSTAELGYRPATRIEDGIERVVKWYRDEGAALG